MRADRRLRQRAWLVHCSWAAALLLSAVVLAQQAPTPGSTGYLIFVRGTPIGREDVTVRTDATGTSIESSGRVSAPLNLTIRRSEFRYSADGTPERLGLDASVNGGDVTFRTLVSNGTATTEGFQQGKPFSVSHQVSPKTVLLPNNVWAAYVGLARRLATVSAGAELRAYVAPNAEVPVRVESIGTDRVQIGASFLTVRRYELVVENPESNLAIALTTDDNASLVRVSIPIAGVDVVREDLAVSTSRTQVHSNPGDEPVTIPVVGFNIGATLTRPKAPTPRLPAVILLAGSGVNDRDGFAYGIPTTGQLAGAMAEAGFLAVRYDRRGFGQSGGRAESATITDYADDARAVMRWLSDRKDVDPKRIAVVGHSEGAWVALLAASRERRLAAVVSIAGGASTGAAILLEQQQQVLDGMGLPPEERAKRVALQKQIQSAALTGKGWEGVPAELRKQADTPWFQSILAFDPAKVLDDVRQPLLFLHGELDRQVPVSHVTRLSDTARKEARSRSIDVVVVRGVNHLLIPATTGEVEEYATLTDRNVSADVRSAVSSWLTKTFAAIK